MKRFVALLVVFLTLLYWFPISASAANSNVSYIYYEDGSTLEISVIKPSASTRSSGTKTGQKAYKLIESNGSTAWIATLYGTFSYDGTICTCIETHCDITIYNNAYSVVNKTVTMGVSTTSAKFTMIRKLLGITISQKDYSIVLMCDKDGNFS